MKRILIPYHQISNIYAAMTEQNFQLDEEYEIDHFLDTDTGEVLYVSSMLIRALFEIEKPLGEITADDLPVEVDPDGLGTYKEIEPELRKRYLEIPKMEPWHGYNDMKAFIEEEEDPKLKSALLLSIQGKGAFSRFKGVLENYSGKIEEWYHFETLKQLGRIQYWLSPEGISLEILQE